MTALEELPDGDKSSLLPIIPIGPWVASKHLEKTLDRVSKAMGSHQWIADLGEQKKMGEEEVREVHNELAALNNPKDNYKNWYQFLEKGNAIPTLRLPEQGGTDIEAQCQRLLQLKRGLVVRFKESHFGAIKAICTKVADALKKHDASSSNTLIIIDYQDVISGDYINKLAEASGYIDNIVGILPKSFISIAASSFPREFKGLNRKNIDIKERSLFNQIQGYFSALNLIHGDYGSARAIREKGGGGDIPPRIDYALPEKWHFFREDAPRKPKGSPEKKVAYMEAYQRLAKAVMNMDGWDEDLWIWGTLMIRRTAELDLTGITSPARSTAVRINLHLHQQVHYGGEPSKLHSTDDDYVD